MSMIIDGSNGATFPSGKVQPDASSPYVMKNRIINGAMVIDQRNAGASITPTTDTYLVDRWKCNVSASSKYSAQQNAGSVTPPAGFTNYFGVTSLSAYTVSGGETFGIFQTIEGYNTADLNWGTANAKTVTLSFWVRSSLTGTFGLCIVNGYASTYSYPVTYTISAANTWQQISITIPGPTAGSWNTTNGTGMSIYFGLGVGPTYSGPSGSWANNQYYGATGATSVVGTNGATWYITGVQLEVGSTATAFEWRPYGTELQLCQRYYELGYYFLCCYGNGTNGVYSSIPIKVSKRASPTATVVSTDSTVNVVGTVTTSVGGTSNAATESLQLTYTGAPATGFTRVGANITMSAEL